LANINHFMVSGLNGDPAGARAVEALKEITTF
jgi:hypothetical protein